MSTTQDAPDYDVQIDADELLSDIAERAADTGEKHAYHDRILREEDYGSVTYRQWEQESMQKLRAYATAIAMLQPESHGVVVPRGDYVADDGTVNVREFMREISRLAGEAHDRRSDAETAYSTVTSLLRNEYGIGWPRLDDLGGNPLEEDLP